MNVHEKHCCCKFSLLGSSGQRPESPKTSPSFKVEAGPRRIIRITRAMFLAKMSACFPDPFFYGLDLKPIIANPHCSSMTCHHAATNELGSTNVSKMFACASRGYFRRKQPAETKDIFQQHVSISQGPNAWQSAMPTTSTSK